MRKSKSSSKKVRKCGKAIDQTGSRIRRCRKRAVARVYSPERGRWVPICAAHASEFRRKFPEWLEYLKSVKA